MSLLCPWKGPDGGENPGLGQKEGRGHFWISGCSVIGILGVEASPSQAGPQEYIDAIVKVSLVKFTPGRMRQRALELGLESRSHFLG